ncbi:MAG: hypothetical protein COA88_01100 [Kordia sp.]|nr:MAG: hypothetical protein COA88_01100 [Kordia sp.]
MFSKLKLLLIINCSLLFVNSTNAQCAMCRAQLEGMDDNSLAKSVNDGIVYLMAVPYILVAVVGFFIYRSFKKKK